MKTVAVVVGAGAGRRMGRVCKALVEIEGRPLVCYALDAFQRSRLVDGIVVAVPRVRLRFFEADFVKRWAYGKILAWVPGGERRQDSVAAALEAVPGSAEWIAVHDAARPFVSPRLIEGLLEAVKQWGAVVPGTVPPEAIKEVGEGGVVRRSLPRESVRAVQTPQVFSASLLREAYRRAASVDVTVLDDAELVEKLGHDVAVVEGDYENIKVTRPIDLETARTIIRTRGRRGGSRPAPGERDHDRADSAGLEEPDEDRNRF